MGDTTTTRVIIRTEDDARAYLASRGLLDSLTIENGKVVESAACWKCGGGGYGYWIPDGGRCYSCGGANTRDRVKRTSLVTYARNTRRRQRAAERRAELAKARREEKEARMLEGQRNWCAANGYGRITFAERDAQREAERLAGLATKVHVGTVGKRMELTLTLDRTHSFERRAYSGYGMETVWIHLFSDEAGNRIVWKSTSCLRVEDAEGNGQACPDAAVVKVRATVKAHDEYRGELQTIVQRMHLCEVVSLPVAAEDAAA